MDLVTGGEISSELVAERDDQPQAFLPSLSTWLKDHVYLASLIVLLAALVPRLFLTLAADPHDLVAPDSSTYFTPAENLLEHGAFLNGHQMPEVSRTPGYPVFILGIMALSGRSIGENWDGLRTILTIQTVILSFSVLFLYWLARHILPQVMAFTGALLAAFSPWGAVRAGFPLTEGLFLLILVLLFLVMYLVVERMAKLSTVLVGGGLIGLLTSAAVLVRPIWPLVPLIAIFVFLLCRNNRQRVWLLVGVMLISASAPLYLWKIRNLREAHFDGLSTISGSTTYLYLASSVKARLKGANGDRWTMVKAARIEEFRLAQGLSLQEIDDECWRRAQTIFLEHPFLTLYAFTLNAGEAVVHPDPSILKPAALNFSGDVWVLAAIWAALLIFAGLGLSCAPDDNRDDGLIQRKWLLSFLSICLLLTLASGVTFGGGSRFRAPLELIVPLLAGVGFVRTIQYFSGTHTSQPLNFKSRTSHRD
jgi:hypothetical protein